MKRNQLQGVRKHIDPASLAVIALTFVLFAAALVVKGFGHDLLLEAGVFLVSVKLIMMAYKASVATATVSVELSSIRSSLARLEARIASEPDAATGGSRADT
jgi:hypothetical protein